MAMAAADEISVDTLDIADVLLVAVAVAATKLATDALALKLFIIDATVDVDGPMSGLAPDIFRQQKSKNKNKNVK